MPISLFRRGSKPRKQAPAVPITVYTRAGCGCCEKALAILKGYERSHGLAIATVDVDGDAALAAEHGANVPVVIIDGKVRFRGQVNPVLLERLLDARQP